MSNVSAEIDFETDGDHRYRIYFGDSWKADFLDPGEHINATIDWEWNGGTSTHYWTTHSYYSDEFLFTSGIYEPSGNAHYPNFESDDYVIINEGGRICF